MCYINWDKASVILKRFIEGFTYWKKSFMIYTYIYRVSKKILKDNLKSKDYHIIGWNGR